MPKSPESEIAAKIFADMGEKCGEKMAKYFADFRPSISKKSGCKKFHEKLATNSAGREIKFFHRETLGVGGHKMFLEERGPPLRGVPLSCLHSLWTCRDIF